jgi:hypothetical protein
MAQEISRKSLHTVHTNPTLSHGCLNLYVGQKPTLKLPTKLKILGNIFCLTLKWRGIKVN